MAFTAADVMRQASTILNDAGAVRWPLTELLDWINAATAEVALLKPTATATTISIALVSGTKQTVPAGYHQILRVLRNTTSGRAVTPTTREIIDTQIPGWHATSVLPFTVDAAHFINEPEDQGAFWVVPGNTGTGSIDVVASAVPAKIARPANPLLIDSYSASVPLHDIYQSAVIDYVLYRAFSKDAAVPGAAQRAQAYYAAFANALGIKTQQETSRTPDAPQSRFSN